MEVLKKEKMSLIVGETNFMNQDWQDYNLK